MNDEDFISKMSTLHHRFWLQSDAEKLIAFANDSLLLRAGMKDQRAAEKYAADNPLGGPANMFDAIASRIRAGENYYAVLADYNLTVNASLTEREEGEWQKAVIDWLVVDCIYSKEHDSNPRKAIGDIVKYETQIALDLAVSSDAQALIDRGVKQGLEAAAKWYADTGWLMDELDVPNEIRNLVPPAQPKHLVRRGMKPDGTFGTEDDDKPEQQEGDALLREHFKTKYVVGDEIYSEIDAFEKEQRNDT